MSFRVKFIYSSLNLELDNKKWAKARINSCRASDDSETKYILLRHEYHNKHSNINIQQFKRANMYSYSFHFSPFVSIETLSHSTTKIVSSFIFNFHSRFHKINHNYFRLTHGRYQFHWYHHHLVGIHA
jgi:hypothetical protein